MSKDQYTIVVVPDADAAKRIKDNSIAVLERAGKGEIAVNPRVTIIRPFHTDEQTAAALKQYLAGQDVSPLTIFGYHFSSNKKLIAFDMTKESGLTELHIAITNHINEHYPDIKLITPVNYLPLIPIMHKDADIFMFDAIKNELGKLVLNIEVSTPRLQIQKRIDNEWVAL